MGQTNNLTNKGAVQDCDWHSFFLYEACKCTETNKLVLKKISLISFQREML